MSNLKELWSRGKDRWKRINEREEDGEKTLDLFVIQILMGIAAAFIATWLWSGMSAYEYWQATKWMFDLGEFSSIGIALGLGVLGLMFFISIFMIGVTHGNFGLPDFVSQFMGVAGGTCWVMAILIMIASFFVALANQFTQLL